MDNNLPPGCRTNKLPGCSEEDVYVDNFIDDRWKDVGLFNEFIYEESPKRVDVPEVLMHRLLRFDCISNAWQEYLAEVGTKSYWSSRQPDA